jgi:DNA-binding NarL/FixJ family response regulator
MNGPRISWRKNGERRLRVLAADDHPLTLANVSTLLAESFELVAAVTDGQQAVDAVRRLDPDVVVLDVTMPKLNGFQTARELTRTGSRAKIVMLTMHQSDDFVAAAVTSGAGAYVLKSRMASDLEAAIDHVIAGRLFVPSLTSLLGIAPAPGAGGQAAQLGVTDRTGLAELSAVLTATLRRGDVAGIVASEATRTGIAERVVANGCDLDEAADRGKYISLDARDALSQCMPGGRLDVGRMAAFVDDLERSRLAASASSVTIVGEPALLLCRDGNAEAAIQLEYVWHDLTRKHPFLTLCPCPMECFSEAGDPDLFSGICAPHSAFCHAHGSV